MTENTQSKNQHFVPKFYLKNFSFENNKNEIGIKIKNSGRFIRNGPIKSQASKDFFYGKDGVVENWLSNLEGKHNTVIKNIILTQLLPKFETPDYYELIKFICLTNFRNPVIINAFKEMWKLTSESIEDFHVQKNINLEEKYQELGHEDSIKIMISYFEKLTPILIDLEYKLLVNKTKFPFITSDLPLIRYNSYLEPTNWPQGKTGFGNIGIQIFIPISPELCLVFFDKDVYKVGNRRNKLVELIDSRDIDQLNLLQVVNSNNLLFFNDKIHNHYIEKLIQTAKKFTTPNKSFLEIEKLKANESGQLMILGINDCEINLNISKIKTYTNKTILPNGLHSSSLLRPSVLEWEKLERAGFWESFRNSVYKELRESSDNSLS